MPPLSRQSIAQGKQSYNRVQMRRQRPATFLLVAALMVAPAAGQEAARPSVAAAVKARLERDLAALVPERQEAPKLLAGVAGVWVLTRLDRGPSRDFADGAPGWLTSLEPLGRFGVGNALGASFLAVGLATGEKKVASRGVAFLEANLLASWLVAGLQNLTGRARPWQAHAGDFGRGGSSFPSAHAAHAFAWAGVLWGSYPEFKARWVFPVLASGVALSRVKERQHFFADVAAGAGIGWWLGSRLGASAVGANKLPVAVMAGPKAVFVRVALP